MSVQVDPKVHNCGCMGTKHLCRTNCMNCGRIFCEKELSEFCLVCGEALLDPLSATEVAEDPSIDPKVLSAYQLKDKLLMFDRENVKRTQVHDAQADYYESSTWLTHEEKRKIDENERIRRKAMSKRNSDIVINLNISNDTPGRIVTAGTISNSIPGGSEESEVKIDDHSNNKNKTLHGNDDNLWNYSPEVSDTTVYNNAVINSSTSGNITNEELLSSHTKAGYLYQLLYAGVQGAENDSTTRSYTKALK